MKTRIQDRSKTEIFNYGANEVGRIAVECPSHKGLHGNDEHVILECVDSKNPAKTGICGESVVTSLPALVQPFFAIASETSTRS